MKYFIKTPWWLKQFYSGYTWSVKTDEKVIYLTFDDGPHAEATPFVLDQLKTFDAKATFFCIGKNVIAEPAIYRRILDEGHVVGNHTFNHLNGWKTDNSIYLNDIVEASKHIDSAFFRPPYGRISNFQAKHIANASKYQMKIIMWDVISADFDETLSGEQCLKNVILNAGKGSIVVMHDSAKAWKRLEYSLPRILSFYKQEGYMFKALHVGKKILSTNEEKKMGGEEVVKG